MITIGIAFVNNNGKFALKSLGTTIGGRPTGTLPQTFTYERVRCERQTNRQTDRQTDSQGKARDRKRGRAGKTFYPLHVESQLPSDDSVDNNDDSWPVMIGCVLVSKQDANEE